MNDHTNAVAAMESMTEHEAALEQKDKEYESLDQENTGLLVEVDNLRSENDTLRDERDAALQLAEENARLSIPALVAAAHATARAKGWHDTPVDFPTALCLIHSEVSEALEYYRDGWALNGSRIEYDGAKPQGIPSELADIAIRLFDTCGLHGIDLARAIEEKMAYNVTRSHRHGGKVV